MTDRLPFFATQLDGKEVSVEQLVPLAFAGYAHFTAMQVRGRSVRGLDLHLDRLQSASMSLFGLVVPEEKIRHYLSKALQNGPDDVSLMATVYSPAGEFTVSGAGDMPRVLIRTAPPAFGPQGPLRLAAFEYSRVLPTIKHVGEVAKTYFLREAVALGFNDAAFVDPAGRLSEGSIWNLAFWDGKQVIWPEAEMLYGTTMGIVRRQLEPSGIPQSVQPVSLDALSGLQGAAVMNSWTPGIAVHQIGSAVIPDAPRFLEILHHAYRNEPFVRL